MRNSFYIVDSSKGFSRGVTIGLSVFAAIVVLLAVGGSISYFRSRHGGIQFNHKSFENPVHTDGGNAFENPLHDNDKDNVLIQMITIYQHLIRISRRYYLQSLWM